MAVADIVASYNYYGYGYGAYAYGVGRKPRRGFMFWRKGKEAAARAGASAPDLDVSAH
jgi:hypothetical protein